MMEVIELISTYEDLIGIQIELLGLKGVTKGQPKHLKTHLLGEQKALNEQIIMGAGLDVYEAEP